jgi:energy-coupling factor transport system substrate-specific component
MRELVTMWRHTKMVVLVALTAAIYAAAIIPLKPIPLIPGITELRPGSVVPVVCSLLFGPAAAWGAAFGNLIGDLFGTLGPGSLFGFIGNFLYGYLPYRIWRSFETGGSVSGRTIIRYLAAAGGATLSCGVTIGWGIDLLGAVPFAALGNIIVVNNLFSSIILGPVLLKALGHRIERLGLRYTDLLAPEDRSEGRFRRTGLALLWTGLVGGLVVGNLLSIGVYQAGAFAAGFESGGAGEVGVGYGLLPFILLILIGFVLI